jgi:hypothetical protein
MTEASRIFGQAGRPYDMTGEGLRLRVRLTPRAGRAAVDGLAQLPDGRWTVRLRVAAPPVEGAANTALIDYLAEALRRPRSSLRIIAGATSRLKTVAIEGDGPALVALVEAWLGL